MYVINVYLPNWTTSSTNMGSISVLLITVYPVIGILCMLD